MGSKKHRASLIKARNALGMKQNQLAPLIGKTQPWLSLVERGIQTVKPRDQHKLAKALKTDLATLGFEDV